MWTGVFYNFFQFAIGKIGRIPKPGLFRRFLEGSRDLSIGCVLIGHLSSGRVGEGEWFAFGKTRGVAKTVIRGFQPAKSGDRGDALKHIFF